MDFPPTRQVDTPPTRKLNRRAADILILFNVFNGNFIPPGCGLVLIFYLREVEWCGFSSCLERVGADFWSAWCGLVRTGADFCYWLVRLVDSRATLCSLAAVPMSHTNIDSVCESVAACPLKMLPPPFTRVGTLTHKHIAHND